MNSEVLDWLRTAPLESEELGEVCAVLAERISAHCLDNDGVVPPSIFSSCLALGSVRPAVEVITILEDFKGRSCILKRRDAGEGGEGWGGKYHVIGQIARLTDDPDKILARITEEIYGEGHKPLTFDSLDFVGVAAYRVEERSYVTWSLVYLHRVTSLKELDGEWREFSDFDDEDILHFHPKLLRWMDDICQSEEGPQLTFL